MVYESPHRLKKLLEELLDVCGGDREIVIARELTKKFENMYGGQTVKLLGTFTDREPRGEFVLAIDPTSLS